MIDSCENEPPSTLVAEVDAEDTTPKLRIGTHRCDLGKQLPIRLVG